LLAASDGSFVADAQPLLRLNVQVIAESPSGRREVARQGGGGRFELARVLRPSYWQPLVDEAVRLALLNLEAVPCPDRRLPSTACDLQARLGATRALAFDIVAACPGFVYALTVAEALVASGQASTVLALGAEKLSTITDTADRSTAILFGDGAGAAVVQPALDDGRGILSSVLGSDGTLADLLYIQGGGGNDPISQKVVDERSHYIRMAGREVFKSAVLAMARACDQALAKAGVTAEDLDLLVPHQANIRIIEATAKHAAVPMSKVMVNVDRYGNTSAASIPLALAQAVDEGRLRPGMLVMLVTFGAGFTWGATVLRW
jgi:3-oxoacyl-[acyl-carrier-protein] synthase-3